MVLTAEGFDTLLSVLAGDREAAGEKYELIRLKLLKYFEWRDCATPEELADETLDRVARRLATGEQIRAAEIMVYVYGVARNVLFEYRKAEQRDRAAAAAQVPLRDEAADDEDQRRAERRSECLARCLEKLPADARQILLRYHQAGHGKIADRQQLARELGIPINALRIRVHRLRNELHRCILRCLDRGNDETESAFDHNR